jgi:hypothetical protein
MTPSVYITIYVCGAGSTYEYFDASGDDECHEFYTDLSIYSCPPGLQCP